MCLSYWLLYALTNADKSKYSLFLLLNNVDYKVTDILKLFHFYIECQCIFFYFFYHKTTHKSETTYNLYTIWLQLFTILVNSKFILGPLRMRKFLSFVTVKRWKYSFIKTLFSLSLWSNEKAYHLSK